MSSYFDKMARRVAGLAPAFRDEDFLAALGEIERHVAETVSLLTGDREFPDKHREKIQGIIAVHGTYHAAASERAKRWAASCRYSHMIDELHEAFHSLARERILTRFGLLDDHPAYTLARRNEHDLDAERCPPECAEDEVR